MASRAFCFRLHSRRPEGGTSTAGGTAGRIVSWTWLVGLNRALTSIKRNVSPQLPTPAEPGLRAANPSVIQLDVSMRFSGGVDHGPNGVVEEQPRGFVSPQTQLPLQPQGRGASFVGDHQVAGQNQIVSGVFVLWRTVPAVSDT